MNPKPSEILRPLLDERGNIKGDSDDYRDKLFGVLDTLDTQHADLERRVAALEGKPKPMVPNIVKWTASSTAVYGYDHDNDCWALFGVGWQKTHCQTRFHSERDITHAEAIDLQPDIAKTHPLPTVKPPLTPEPASEPAPASVEEDGYTAENAASLMAKGIASAPPMFNVKRYIKTHLTAFAARAVSREKARADALQAWKEEALGALGEHPDTELDIRQRISDIRDEGRGHFHMLGKVQGQLHAAEEEVRRLRALIDEWAANANKLIVQKSDGLPKGAVR